MKAFSIRQVGIGDGVQFTSLPENYFLSTGKKLIDVSHPWYFDYNPFVERGEDAQEKDTIELWNYPKKYEWPVIRDSVYLSNAEIHASIFGVKSPRLIRPRLYRYEDFPFEQRETILFHPHGRSHGSLPDPVIDHVLKKYGPSGRLVQIGLPTEPSVGIPRLETSSYWELTEAISKCQMLIGIDSGPSWIAACYPDIVVKKVRTMFQYGYCEPKDWVPLDVRNIHSFWDDRAFQIYNVTEDDVGFTMSYRKL
jgi:hypothetical protein